MVPFDRKQELGYRELLESDASLKKILARFDKIDNAADKIEFTAAMTELQPIVTGAFIAVDECDFGTALELATDLFCHGTANLHDVMKPLFITAYSQLKRPQFIAIIKVRLKDAQNTELINEHYINFIAVSSGRSSQRDRSGFVNEVKAASPYWPYLCTIVIIILSFENHKLIVSFKRSKVNNLN